MIMKNIIAHFDISPQGDYCDGYISLENGVITKHLDGAEEKFNISDIEEAVKEGCFSIKYYMDLFPETKQTLIDYGYGVVCPDDGGKCWEISWDSSTTPQLSRR